ncbi:hypothetical protein B1757_13815 [Acidithiobacillus marinus]|uniref:Uncharacterized protein n=1 Tax=Acidithiobacillus marinus TaxID=187490 RepID=A0A2I1DII5_9PROT|nr:hypothetical protein [Acidithiobacillus marinus]PKY09675.1 hypothetical protein B1757_13815 [Acidithiobacillus marinus]
MTGEVVDHRPPLRPVRGEKKKPASGSKPQRNRRTREEILADLQREEMALKSRMEKKLNAIRERRERLSETPENRRRRERERRAFEKAWGRIAPDMGYAHILGALQMVIASDHDMAALKKNGDKLIAAHGLSRKTR